MELSALKMLILGADLLSANADHVITGEQSSLMLTYQMILSKYLFAKPVPWRDIETQNSYVLYLDSTDILEILKILESK